LDPRIPSPLPKTLSGALKISAIKKVVFLSFAKKIPN
jgi:hypothetical protein